MGRSELAKHCFTDCLFLFVFGGGGGVVLFSVVIYLADSNPTPSTKTKPNPNPALTTTTGPARCIRFQKNKVVYEGMGEGGREGCLALR